MMESRVRIGQDEQSGEPRRVRFLSAGVIILRRFRKGERFLLLRVYRQWDFPKGLVERGEDPLAAAVREVEEETTLRDLRFNWGDRYRETAVYGRGKVARYYLAESPRGEVALPVSPELGRPEHHEFRWLAASDAERRLSPRLRPIFRWALQHFRDGANPAAAARPGERR